MNGISVYVAAPWPERPFAKAVRKRLCAAGIEVTSRWLDFPGESHDPEVLRQEAHHDYADVLRAEALLLLNMQKRGEETSGHAVETGLALAAGKRIVMVGEPSNVFHYLECVERVQTVDEAIALFMKED